MIHYHGGPVTPTPAAIALWARRHAMVSFAYPQQIALAAEVCQSFALDNGAFSIWRNGGGQIDVKAYADWVNTWRRHPGFDWALIPDVIDGSEADNDRMLGEYRNAGGELLVDVPVWHLHESIDRFVRLTRTFSRVALGSSGAFAAVGTATWWNRMSDALDAACDEQGSPPCRLHGLRMLNPEVFTRLPLASADSTTVARNVGLDNNWRGRFPAVSKDVRALVLADRIERHNAAPAWKRFIGHQEMFDLFPSSNTGDA